MPVFRRHQFDGVSTEQSSSSANTTDHGLGVPPYHSVQTKGTSSMARASFALSSSQPQTGRSLVLGRSDQRDPSEWRTLVVGHGISVQGTVQDAEKLVVEGAVEATMIRANELSVAPGGVFKGEAEVENAEIAGTIDGTLTARGNMVVRASGQVLGTARCRRLQVEDGGKISGHIEMLEDTPKGIAATSHELPRLEPVQPASEAST